MSVSDSQRSKIFRYPCRRCGIDVGLALYYATGNAARWGHICDSCHAAMGDDEQRLYAREPAEEDPVA